MSGRDRKTEKIPRQGNTTGSSRVICLRHLRAEVVLFAPAGLDKEEFRFAHQILNVTNLSDETLDVPGLVPLPVQQEVVSRPVADHHQQEAVVVSVEFVLSQLPLHSVHTLARQVPVHHHLEPCISVNGP